MGHEPAPTRRLPGFDGVRGLAALFVVLNHVFERAFPGYPADTAPWWAAPFIYGRFAVVVFIVLSGFSLALRPARDGWRLGSMAGFAQRRARRILPAYYAALVFSLAVAWLVVAQPGQGAPTVDSVAVHASLLQNLAPAPSPNAAFWSIAVEAQLYVLFPLLLLAVRRRGAATMLAGVTVVVAAIGIAGQHDGLVLRSPPDLAALFALGILAAGVRRHVPRWVALAALAPPLALIVHQGSVWTLDHVFWIDLALGPAIACLIIALAQRPPNALDSRPLQSLGRSSYSLYLTHAPIVLVVYTAIAHGRHGPGAFLTTAAVAVPLTIAFARVFAAAFERGPVGELRRVVRQLGRWTSPRSTNPASGRRTATSTGRSSRSCAAGSPAGRGSTGWSATIDIEDP